MGVVTRYAYTEGEDEL